MPTKRTIAQNSVRGIVGIIGIAVAGASIIAATWLPLPSFTAGVPSSTVTPVPTDQQRVCPGPLLELAADSSNATGASAFGSVSTVKDSSSGSVKSKELKAVDDTKADSYGGPTLLSLAAQAGETTPPMLAGAQSQVAAEDDLAGLAASGCGEATRSSWLVAGSNDLGQTSLLLLSNPSAVQASVDVTLYGETGQVEAPGAQGILVDAGAQRVVALSGLAPNVKAPVVHVQSRGGSILASLQQSVVRGLAPGGVEMASATAPPAKHQVVPGMTVAGTAAAAGGTEGYADTAPALRVLVPGDKPATVRVGIVGEKGTVGGGSSASATLQPKTVQEIPLDKLVDGSFTLTVDSDQPVVVAARTSVSDAKAADFAWFAAPRALRGDTLVPVAKGAGAVIHLANTSSKDASVTVGKGSAAGKSVSVPANTAVGVPIDEAGAYTVTGAQGMFASVSYAGKGLSSSFPIEPPGALASPITVFPR
jgi:hypothetical protein